jgi:hypothetical protein
MMSYAIKKTIIASNKIDELFRAGIITAKDAEEQKQLALKEASDFADRWAEAGIRWKVEKQAEQPILESENDDGPSAYNFKADKKEKKKRKSKKIPNS